MICNSAYISCLKSHLFFFYKNMLYKNDSTRKNSNVMSVITGFFPCTGIPTAASPSMPLITLHAATVLEVVSGMPYSQSCWLWDWELSYVLDSWYVMLCNECIKFSLWTQKAINYAQKIHKYKHWMHEQSID